MQQVIGQMLSKYKTDNVSDKKNAIKEVVQEIVLCGLSRGGFFKETAFYGGTALRIFYGLDRFSEDLDFSLIDSNKDFDLTKYSDNVAIFFPDSYHLVSAYKTASGKGANLNTEELIFLTADFSV